MKAVILAAGQGTRLLPLTSDRPKCLVEIGDGVSIIEQQLASIERSGTIDEVLLVLGYKAELVEATLRRLSPRTPVQVVYNPFFDESNALVSLWLALQRRPSDFVVINGDVIFSPQCLERLASAADDEGALVLASRRSEFGVDAVKVVTLGSRLLRIGKEIAGDLATGESAGLIRFHGAGASAAIATIEQMVRERENRHRFWYTLVLRLLDDRMPVYVRECPPDDWFEVDYHGDLEQVRMHLAPAGRLRRGWDLDASGYERTAPGGRRS